MKTKIYLFVSLIVMLLSFGVVSCQKEAASEDNFSILNEDEVISVFMEEPVGESGESLSTRSGMGNPTISNLRFFVFDDNGEFVKEKYVPSGNTVSKKDLFYDATHGLSDHFDVYVVGNFGPDFHTSDNAQKFLNRNTIDSAIYSFSDPDVLENLGFPCASVYYDYCPKTGDSRLLAKRLFCEYHISFSSSNDNYYDIYQINVKNSASMSAPFKDSFKLDYLNVSKFDYSYGKDVIGNDAFSDGTVIYVMENDFGTDPYSSGSIFSMDDKTELNISDYYQKRCTYFEFIIRQINAEYTSYYKVSYKYYPGDSYKDFSIHRNMYKTLNIDIDSLIPDNGWPDEILEEKHMPTIDHVEFTVGPQEHNLAVSGSTFKYYGNESSEQFGVDVYYYDEDGNIQVARSYNNSDLQSGFICTWTLKVIRNYDDYEYTTLNDGENIGFYNPSTYSNLYTWNYGGGSFKFSKSPAYYFVVTCSWKLYVSFSPLLMMFPLEGECSCFVRWINTTPQYSLEYELDSYKMVKNVHEETISGVSFNGIDDPFTKCNVNYGVQLDFDVSRSDNHQFLKVDRRYFYESGDYNVILENEGNTRSVDVHVQFYRIWRDGGYPVDSPDFDYIYSIFYPDNTRYDSQIWAVVTIDGVEYNVPDIKGAVHNL